MRYKSNVSNEGYEKWANSTSVPENDKFDWLVKPNKEGIYYNLTVEQSSNIDQCIYGSYYSNVIAGTSYLLINKY